jgi:hypothetical protein
MRIWKFPLTLTADQFVALPEGAQILTVDVDPHRTPIPALWALVDDKAAHKPRRILMAATGAELDFDVPVAYFGTVNVGGFVAHFFEAKEPPPAPVVQPSRSFIGGEVK